MEKAYTLNYILTNLESTSNLLESTARETPDTPSAKFYWRQLLHRYQKRRSFWLKKLKEFGKTTVIEVTGEMMLFNPSNEIYTRQKFTMIMAGVNKEDVSRYLEAQANYGADKILLDTIKLKEFQTGRFIIT